jgi:DNA modification methylase
MITKVIIGDIRESYKYIEDNSIDCIVTSPPYFQQRDYGVKNQVGLEKTPEEYATTIANIFKLLYNKLKKTGTIFLNIGYKYLQEELILVPELVALEMTKNGYLLKNKIIWHKPNAMPTPARNRLNNTYEAVFFFIKKEGKEVFYFNLDNFNNNNELTFSSFRLNEDFLGAMIEDNLTFRDKRNGIVIGVDKNNNFILVEWGGGKREEIEVIEYPHEIKFRCTNCDNYLTYWDIHLSYANEKSFKCKFCQSKNLPKPYILKPKFKLNNDWVTTFSISPKTKITSAKGSEKYKRAQLLTSSPAGRIAITGEKFIIKRKYKFPQPLIADYLKYHFRKNNLKPEDIDKYLGYKHTVGHWLRKDFSYWGKGGSLPRPGDWFKLKEILNLDNTYDDLMTSIAAVFSTIKEHPRGKNIGDVWNISTEPSQDEHFAVFPENLVEYCLKLGCPIGGTCLDPFAGTGTVAKVANRLKINAVLCEINSNYLSIIKRKCLDAEVIFI